MLLRSKLCQPRVENTNRRLLSKTSGPTVLSHSGAAHCSRGTCKNVHPMAKEQKKVRRGPGTTFPFKSIAE